ncbi:efflux RND transporter periplasmic adaptor subunit [Acidobacteriota bacterium]
MADVTAKKAQAEASVTEASAMLKNAEITFARIEQLYEKKSATKKEYDDAEASLLGARARVMGAESMKTEAEVTQQYGEIRAPFDGIVTGKFVERGDMAAPGHPLVIVEDQSKVKVAVRVPEREIRAITAGMKLEFFVEAASQDKRAGTVDEITPSADPVNRTFDIDILADNEDGALLPGMYARVDIPLGEREGIKVTGRAVHKKGQLEGVFIVDEGGHARLYWIKTGAVIGDSVEILSGIKNGDLIVVSSEKTLLDGQPVKVTYKEGAP